MPNGWRRKASNSWIGPAALAAVFIVLVGWPIAMVLIAAWTGRADSEPGLTPSEHRASLAIQTALLVLITLAIALPIGVTTALLISRTDVPAKPFWSLVVLLPALVPIDLHATAWLAAAGPQGLARSLGLPVELKGLFGAAWIHAMAAIPWIAALVGVAVSLVESELEEDCLLLVGPLRTMWHVTLRRSAGAVVAVALFVGVITAGEMAVTDLLGVRTYAETVYTEFALKGRVGAATATAVPGLVVWLVLIAAAGWLIVRRVPQETQALFARRPIFRLGRVRWLAAAGCASVVAATFGVPAASLVWRAGLKYPMRPASTGSFMTRTEPRPDRDSAGRDAGSPSVSDGTVAPKSTTQNFGKPQHIDIARYRPRWSVAALVENVRDGGRAAERELILSLVIAGLTAICVVPLALLLAVFARESRAGKWFAAVIACTLFALPGPVLGIALKLALLRPTKWWGDDPSSLGGAVAGWLANVADSTAVLVWLHGLRTLPFALAVLWPAVRLVNRSLLEAAAIDGAGAWRRFRHVELPAVLPSVFAAAIGVAVLSIGELAGSVIVTPPGEKPLTVLIFGLAHNGVDNHLAGICLVLLLIAAAGSVAAIVSLGWAARRVEG